MTDLMKPQAAYNHESVRDIIEDITQSSMMRLDAVSMSKLWDLITMVYKWQITNSNDVIDLTLRHLYEIENYVTKPDTQLQIHQIQNLIDNFNKILSAAEKKELHDSILYWLKDSNVRVSLLLRMGLQNMDGIFISENLDPVAEKMLKNLGENIYSVTQNGKVLEKSETGKSDQEVNELQLFVNQILGEKSQSLNNNKKFLRLAINQKSGSNNNSLEETTSEGVNNINVDNKISIDNLMTDLTMVDKDEPSLTDELLSMIDNQQLNN